MSLEKDPSPKTRRSRWFVAAAVMGGTLVIYTVVVLTALRVGDPSLDPRVNHLVSVGLAVAVVGALLLGARAEARQEREDAAKSQRQVLTTLLSRMRRLDDWASQITARINTLKTDTGDLAMGVGRKVAQDEAARAEIAQLRTALAASDHDRDLLLARMREDLESRIAEAVGDAYRRGMVQGAEEDAPLRLVPPPPAQSGRS